MKTFLSPAKSLNFEDRLEIGPTESIAFPDASATINKTLRKFKAAELMTLQKVSEKIASLNQERNAMWSPELSGQERQAALAFTGDVYQGLEAQNWSEADMEFASDHILILSGLYGVLKPNTLIKPYRLEMGTKLKVGRAKDLYSFWEKPLQAYFEKHLPTDETIINLASQEYFKAFAQLKRPNPVVEVVFKDFSKGKYKVLSFYAKRARGLMANYIVQHKVNDWEELKDFNLDGYYYHPESSSQKQLVFLRDNI